MVTLETLQEGLVLFERYRLEAPLGRERTGHTWRANDLRLDLTVAIKVFDNHPKPSALEESVKNHMDVTNPNLVRLFEFAGNSDRCAVVMEYEEGRSLATLLRNRFNPWFDVAEIRRWTEQLLTCISAVHKHGRVHGNLNLENLLLNDRSDLKVLDLGLRDARLQSRNSDLAFSSPACTSPQALNDGPVQPVDDLYSIGASVYELLTGKPVFSGGNVPMQIEAKPPIPVNVRRAELGVGGEPVPEEWESWINSCLAKERRDRPQNAEAVLDIVRRTVGTAPQPVPATASAAATTPPTAAMPQATYITAHGMATMPIPMMMPHQPAPSSPWGKIVLGSVAVIGLVLFYFGSWKPEHAQMRQMEADFQKVRQAQNQAPEELAALREVGSVLEDFVSNYAGVEILYSERDDILRTQAEERHDACIVKIKALERQQAVDLQKEREEKQVALKTAFDKATETSNAVVSARAKRTKWQTLVDDFGDWDNPDDVQDNKMIADARAQVDKYKVEQDKEAEQMMAYRRHLESAIDNAITIKANATLTPGLKWKAFSEWPKPPAKPPGEQEGDFTMLEKTYDDLRKELDEAARKETPSEPHTVKTIFANSSFASLSDDKKTGLINVAQAALKQEGLLQLDHPDGQAGEATHKSIAEFQMKNGLVASGELTDATLWQMGYEGTPITAVKAEEAKPVKKASTGTSTRSKRTKIPPRPPESTYDGFMGSGRLAKDKLTKKVNPAELKKHERSVAWEKKYGDMDIDEDDG